MSDHSRPLNQRGRLAAGAMRQAMLGLALAPDVVLVSSSRRTLQTLEALEPWEDTPIVEPMDVTDIGRMAVFVDPTGAAFGIWQPKTFAGADLVNEPNSLCWNEVLTRDADTNKAFYSAVFGWEGRPPAFEGAPETYTVWELDGKQVGGMMQMTDEYFPAEIPPHWGVCFAVADCDATVAKARELGATVTNEPMDMPIGRFAGLIDLQGASFTVMAPAAG